MKKSNPDASMRETHDMGGLPAGPIDRSEHEYEFFEKRVDALRLLLSTPERRIIRVDELRRAVESLPDYRELSYYERWIQALRLLLVEKGVLDEQEISERMRLIANRQPTPGDAPPPSENPGG